MTTKELVEHLDICPDIMIYFYNPECKYCKETTPIISNKSDIHMVDTYDESEEVSDLFGIEYVPALAIVKETDAGLDYVIYDTPDKIKEYFS